MFSLELTAIYKKSPRNMDEALSMIVFFITYVMNVEKASQKNIDAFIQASREFLTHVSKSCGPIEAYARTLEFQTKLLEKYWFGELNIEFDSKTERKLSELWHFVDLAWTAYWTKKSSKKH